MANSELCFLSIAQMAEIAFGADEINQFGGVAARHFFEFAEGHLRRVTDDAAFRTAKRNVHDRAFPRHPRRQRTHFVERDVRRITNAAFGRAAREVVLHAIAGENFDVAVVHKDRNINGDFAIRYTQNFIKVGAARDFDMAWVMEPMPPRAKPQAPILPSTSPM